MATPEEIRSIALPKQDFLWLANCYFAHFSSGSQLNVTMLRWAENG
jgi:hypothetical protein